MTCNGRVMGQGPDYNQVQFGTCIIMQCVHTRAHCALLDPVPRVPTTKVSACDAVYAAHQSSAARVLSCCAGQVVLLWVLPMGKWAVPVMPHLLHPELGGQKPWDTQ